MAPLRILTAALLLAAPAAAATPRVVTDIAQVPSLTARVMAGLGAPDLLIPPAATPHDHAMRSSEARALQSADLVVRIGDTLTPTLGARIATPSDGPVPILADLPGIRALEIVEEKGRDHDHAPGALDPHLRLDPGNASAWTDAIAAALAEADPANAGAYAANAAAAAAAEGELAALAAEIASLLEPVRDRPVVVDPTPNGISRRPSD